MTVNVGDNRWATANFIVAPTIAQGASYTTITAALAAASSGNTIFVKPGTYTENLTLKAGVNIVAYTADSQTPNVIIVGNATGTFSGTCSISGIRLQTNGAAFLTVSGSSATIVNLFNCYLNCTDATGISFSSSSASARINLSYCMGNITDTGISLFASSSAGFINLEETSIDNTGNSTTASTISDGTLGIFFCHLKFPITSSGTASISINQSLFNTNATNTLALTHNGTGANSRCAETLFLTGSGACISIGAGATLTCCLNEIASTNANPVTGAGTLRYTPFAFTSSGNGVNTTTRTPTNFGSWTPTITGATAAGTTTYTTQFGQYTIVGNIVLIEATIVITAATGTGNATIGGLPFTVKNITNYNPRGIFSIASAAWAWPAGTTQTYLNPTLGATTAIVSANGSTAAGVLQMTNGAATFVLSTWYQI